MKKDKYENKMRELAKIESDKKKSFIKKLKKEKIKKIEPVREKWVPSPVVKINPKAKNVIKKEEVPQLPNAFSKADQLGKK
jgi:hypothetical protein